MRRLLALVWLAACQRETAPPTVVQQTKPTVVVAPAPDVAPTKRHIDLVSALPDGPIAPYVQAEMARAKTDGRRLLVYVGATWCEPCRRFHDAAKAGELDDAFSDLRLLEFDLDRDRDRLAADGYRSEMIPLIALPGADGKGNGRGMQGSVKGEGAVAQMRPRLEELLRLPDSPQERSKR